MEQSKTERGELEMREGRRDRRQIRRTDGVPAMLATGGLAAAFGAATCCALPLFMARFALGAGWRSGITIMATPHRSSLLTAAAVLLIAAAGIYWWQARRARCASDAICARPALRMLTLSAILAGSVLLAAGSYYA